MHLLRSFGGCHADVVAIDWSPDSKWIAVASKDLTARVFSAEPVPGFVPPTLTGHKDALVGVFFASEQTRRAAMLLGDPEPSVFTVSADGALYGYTFKASEALPVEAVQARHAEGVHKRKRPPDEADESESESESDMEVLASDLNSDPAAYGFAYGSWALTSKNFFHQPHTKLTAVDYHPGTGLLVTAFSTGHFLLHQLPDFEHLQSLSISRHSISTVAFNSNGEWLALGCAALGQLLVWEWRSETYVLKQQGHFYDVSVVCFSPDGTHIASGADDFKVKVWSVASGSCFVTFSDHTGAVTGLVFTPTSNALVSCSLDGTVRAFDLVRCV
jgi:periodic tryptophan protein 2